MEYIGEHILPGQVGHFMAVMSFVTALLSVFAYYWATQKSKTSFNNSGYDTLEVINWRNLGRFSFLLHGLSTFGIIAVLFYILTGKMYEYQYAWANVSDDLPMQYVFSAFWKEQQGSFLLWSFWHIALSIVLMVKAGKWEAPVMTVIALAEAIIASMVLGIYFGDFRLGASPFDLLRDTMDAPIFQQANYLSKVKGNGLNPLLQNYWMTIHPPTLFLGFASTIVPFAYAISGLWLREHKAWLQPALKWSLFSGAILGTGILMGGAWAYEALSFAGYWAWDPVENSSLVPWIVMVAGIHTNLIARATGYSIRSTYAFYLLSFILILYSTYLTRSGILGDTSAHAFTEMGLEFQLILFIAGFSALGLWLWISRYNEVPDAVVPVQNKVNFVVGADGQERAEMHTEINKKQEEGADSREFWMFIGALVLFLSAVLITGATSLPAWNKIVQIFNPDYVGAALKDPMEHHNRYQLWIAVFIGMLTGIAQFLRFGERNWQAHQKPFFKYMAFSAAVAAVLTWLNSLWIDVHAWQIFAMLFAGMFAVVSNAAYLIAVLKGNLKLAGSAISHLGFGVLVLGILSTGLNKTWISTNNFAMEGLIEGASEDDMNKNVILMKEAPMPIKKDFTATYLKDTIERQTRTFSVKFQKRDSVGDPNGTSFVLTPNVMYDRQFTKVVASNPSTQHYWNYDIFTHVSSLPKAELDQEYAKQQEDSLQFDSYSAVVGDTIFTKKHYIVVEGYTKNPKHPDYKPEKGDLAIGLNLRVHSLDFPQTYKAEPMLYLRLAKGGFTLPAFVGPLQMKVRMTEASMEKILEAEDALKFEKFNVPQGSEFNYQGYRVTFKQVERTVQHPSYAPEPGDIAVAATLEIVGPDGKKWNAAPVFLIRGNQPYSLKDEVPELGLHFKFDNIDPSTGIMVLSAAQMSAEARKIPIEIAENAPRGDYIVLEAIIFPGINYVWIGCILMLFGLAISLWKRFFS